MTPFKGDAVSGERSSYINGGELAFPFVLKSSIATTATLELSPICTHGLSTDPSI